MYVLCTLFYCATNGQIVGSVLSGVIGILHITALWPRGSTQPVTEMNTRNSSEGSGGKDGRCVELTTLPPSCADCLEILGVSNSWGCMGLSRLVQE
jgi:hypothetical protein